MSRNRFAHLESVPTEELSARALDMLRAGQTESEFLETTEYLTVCVSEKQAVVEGTLLTVGAELDDIAKAASLPLGNKDIDQTALRFARDRPMFLYLSFAQGIFDADPTSRLRPIGREIVSHCLLLSNDGEATAALMRIKDSGTHSD